MPRVLDPDYNDFLLVSTKAFRERGTISADQDLLLKLMEECGEVANAYSRYAGTNPSKPRTGNMVPVVQELADVVCTALVAIVALGFDPNDLLDQQMRKVKALYSDIWDES